MVNMTGNYMITTLIIVAGLFAALLVIPLLIPVRPLTGLRPARELADTGSRFVTIPFAGTAGLALHVREQGDGDLQFLLLHGFTFNSFTWEPVLAGFAKHGRVVAYDRVPFGLSQKLVEGDWRAGNPYTPDATVRQLESFVTALGMTRPILVGNSAGAFLAILAVLATPERYRGLILVAPSIPGRMSRIAVPFLGTPQLRHIGPLLARMIGRNEWLLRRSYADPGRITDEQLGRCAIATRMTDWDLALWASLYGGTKRPLVRNDLPRIAVPTLIIGGNSDRVEPPKSFMQFAQLIPGAELVMLKDAGHLPQEENPRAFMAAVDEWTGRHFPQTG